MSNRWTRETTIKFVSLYVERECLWDIRSPTYKNKQMRISAYMDIEKKMNLPRFGVKEIRLKIKNIRSTYSQELRKIKDSKTSGSGTNDIYIPSLKWFSILDTSLKNLNSTLTESENNLHSRKLSQLSSMVDQLKEITETANSAVAENGFDVFGKHVAVQLKSLPLLSALEAQEHIQIYLNRIRRNHLHSSQKNIDEAPESSLSDNWEEQSLSRPSTTAYPNTFSSGDIIFTSLHNVKSEH